MDESTNKAIDFIRHLLDLGLISREQADLLVQFVEGTFPSYKNNEELSRK